MRGLDRYRCGDLNDHCDGDRGYLPEWAMSAADSGIGA